MQCLLSKHVEELWHLYVSLISNSKLQIMNFIFVFFNSSTLFFQFLKPICFFLTAKTRSCLVEVCHLSVAILFEVKSNRINSKTFSL